MPPHTHTAVLATGRGEAAALAVLHDGLRDPVDSGVIADGIVARVHGDHLKHPHVYTDQKANLLHQVDDHLVEIRSQN